MLPLPDADDAANVLTVHHEPRPGRPAFRSVAIDARRGIELLTAADQAPESEDRPDYLTAHENETRLVVFDLATGNTLAEQVILAPAAMGGRSLGPSGLALVSDILCAFNGPLAYGLTMP